jgi:hypothetical protein
MATENAIERAQQILKGTTIRSESASMFGGYVEWALGYDEEHTISLFFDCLQDLEDFCRRAIKAGTLGKLAKDCLVEWELESRVQ